MFGFNRKNKEYIITEKEEYKEEESLRDYESFSNYNYANLTSTDATIKIKDNVIEKLNHVLEKDKNMTQEERDSLVAISGVFYNKKKFTKICDLNKGVRQISSDSFYHYNEELLIYETGELFTLIRESKKMNEQEHISTKHGKTIIYDGRLFYYSITRTGLDSDIKDELIRKKYIHLYNFLFEKEKR